MMLSAAKTISFTEPVEPIQLQLSHNLVQCIDLQGKLLVTLHNKTHVEQAFRLRITTR